jgi:alpha-amylase/alpha-mannosidase (GH57 family)
MPMTDRVALLFGVHAHQPAGNFTEVIAHAHERCYAPFLRTLAEYPGFRFAIHISGPLLDKLGELYPNDIELLGDMVARGQVELFGAGDAEPVLASIPHRDRVSQVESLSAKLALRFGKVPHGAWLTERVWESSVVPSLAQCGIRYATVDDYHFLCTGCDGADLDRYFTTEESGATLDIFPISEALRYRIPFSTADEAIRYLESLAQPGRTRAAIYFDDIEKLGIWPETYEWVYQRRWLRDFVERVLASKAVRPMHFAEFHAQTRTGGVVYLPTASYVEMNEWTLPPSAAAEYAALVDGEKRAGRYASRKGYVRGGIWRNFLSRYPESNWMHKRMLALSTRLADSAGDDNELRSLLHLAQANDAYWHGLFGGLYLPHLRRCVYSNLLALEAKLDAIDPRPPIERVDLDLDGVDELFLHTSDVQAVVRLDGTAAIRELDSYALAQNFGDTLRRHREHYHRLAVSGASNERRGGGIASAHDRVAFRHAISAADIAPDSEPRDVARDTWTPQGGDERPIDSYVERAAGDGAAAAFAASLPGLTIEKRIAVDGNAVIVRYDARTDTRGVLRTTLDFAMPSCTGFSGRYIVGDDIPCGFGQPLDVASAGELVLDDRCIGGGVALRFEPAARIAGRPYHTVSQSEDGFEKVMQSATVVAEWTIEPPSARAELRLVVRAD